MAARKRPGIPLRWHYFRYGVGTLAGALGPALAGRMATALAQGIHDLRPPVREVIEANLRRVFPKMPAEHRDRLCRAAFEHVALFWVECLFARRRLSHSGWPACIKVDNLTFWGQIAESARPAILVSGYVGNPAFGAFALGQMLPQLSVLVDPISEWLIGALSGRRRVGLKLVSRVAPAEISAALSGRGKLLVLLGSRQVQRGGVECVSLGRRSQFPATIGRLAHRHQADIVVFACRRQADMPARLKLEMLDFLPFPDLPRTARETMQHLLTALERYVCTFPEQYLWTRA